jgi:hypothetical protein
MSNRKAYALFALDAFCYLGAISALLYFGLAFIAIAVMLVFVTYLYFAVPRLQAVIEYNDIVARMNTLDVNDLSQNSKEI